MKLLVFEGRFHTEFHLLRRLSRLQTDYTKLKTIAKKKNRVCEISDIILLSCVNRFFKSCVFANLQLSTGSRMLCLQENGFHNGGSHETNDVVYNNGSYEVPTFMKVRDICCMCSLKRLH